MIQGVAKEAFWKCPANKNPVNRKAGCTHSGKESLLAMQQGNKNEQLAKLESLSL